MIKANGPNIFASNALSNSPRKIKDIECPNPSPGQYEKPMFSNKHNPGPLVVFGSIKANNNSPTLKAAISK